MKLAAQEEYGLRCLLRLAGAGPDHPLTIPDIAAAEGLSPAYVAKLLSRLGRSGLVVGTRGRIGGYRLAAAPADISLAGAMAALGGRLFGGAEFCRKHAGAAGGICVRSGDCSVRAVWRVLDQRIGEVLESLTLADLLAGERATEQLVHERLSQSADIEAPRELRFLAAGDPV